MRIALSIVVGLLLAPSRSSADTIVFTSDESSLDFGSIDAEHHVFPSDTFHLVQDGASQILDWHVQVEFFDAVSGPLLQKTVTTDPLGNTNFDYLYDGGTTVNMLFDLHNLVTGESRSGSFVAPLLGMHLFGTLLPCCGDYGEVQVFYDLGPGLFDASIADALGIRQQSLGGSVDDPYLIFLRPNDFPPFEFRADEGAPTVTIEVVPEPPLPLLSLLGFGAAWLCRRRLRAH